MEHLEVIMIDKTYLEKLFQQINVELTESQLEKFDSYAELLLRWNEKINLTAITEPLEVCEKHFLDSVMPFTLINHLVNGSIDSTIDQNVTTKNCDMVSNGILENFNGKTFIDVGTGAGFPSCPLKIVNDSISITLLDSLNKRIKFLETISDELDLEAISIHGRAEEFGNKFEYREKFDIATARAVANLSDLCEYCLPFVKKGGYFIALKGSAGQDEAKQAKNAIKTLGAKVKDIKEYSLPNGDMRTVIVIEKISSTPTKYPRNKGQMKKKPL